MPKPTDDAGKPIKILNPVGASEWPAKGDVRIAQLVERLSKVRSKWPTRTVLASVLVACCAFIMFGSLVFLLGAPPWVGNFGPIVVGSLLADLMFSHRVHLRANQVIRLTLAEGLCPCCAYNLHGVPIDTVPPYALIACPECGASWRRRRIVRTAPFAPGSPMSIPTMLLRRRQGGSLGSWYTRDEANEPVRLVHPRFIAALDSATNEDHRARLLGAREQNRHSGRAVRLAASLVLITAGVAIAIVVPSVSLHSIGGVVVVLAILVAAAIAVSFSNFAYSPRTIRANMLAHDLCPSCGADLRSTTERTPEGHTPCPTCRAEWKSEPR